jgi:tryptophan synthase alpha chain
MGGDPDPQRFLEYAERVASYCDVLEIGIPFSDPIADGPTIQAASVRALQSGTRVRTVIEGCTQIASMVPVVIMCYYNTVFRAGEENFARLLAASGISGLIVPDLPYEHANLLRRYCKREGVDLIHLATPATREERAMEICRRTSGFLYLVSRYGVTGERTELQSGVMEMLWKYKAISHVPVAVGFGISTPEHVRALSKAGADGVVIGSALVSRVAANRSPEELASFVRELREASFR